MKACRYLLFAGLMVVGLLFYADPALAWNDTMPHFGNGGCSSHMVNPTHVGTSSYTFYMCVANSQADTWTAYLTNKVTGVRLTNCGLPLQAVNGDATFQCTVPSGIYTATISYTVPGSSPFPHTDAYYVSP